LRVLRSGDLRVVLRVGDLRVLRSGDLRVVLRV